MTRGEKIRQQSSECAALLRLAPVPGAALAKARETQTAQHPRGQRSSSCTRGPPLRPRGASSWGQQRGQAHTSPPAARWHCPNTRTSQSPSLKIPSAAGHAEETEPVLGLATVPPSPPTPKHLMRAAAPSSRSPNTWRPRTTSPTLMQVNHLSGLFFAGHTENCNKQL